MPNAKDFPIPNPKIDYKLAYTQGDAVAQRKEFHRNFINAVIKVIEQHGRLVGAWFHDDAFGVIDTGGSHNPDLT